MENRKYIPARIRQARVSRGLSLTELANAVDVTRQAVSQYELGAIEPSEGIMRGIVDSLRYPLDFFRKPMPEMNQNFSESSMYYRKKAGVSAKLKDAAKERVVQFAEVDNYFRQYVDFPEVDRFDFPVQNYIDNNGAVDAVAVAQNLREYWKLGDSPINNLTMLLEKKGIMISIMSNKQAKIDAYSNWYKNGIPYIFYGSEKQSAVRMRFDLAHELGHLVMHNHISESELAERDIYNRVENEANTFAGAFLLPESSFVQLLYSSSIDHLLMLKRKWKVSAGAMIYRAEELGALTPNQIKYLKDQMGYRNYWRKEPYDDEITEESPVCLSQAFNLLKSNGLITADKLLSDLPYYPDELETMCFFKRGTLQEDKEEHIKNVIRLKFQ